MKRPNAAQIAALKDLYDLGGAVISSKWTTGSGRYISRRAVPPHCSRIERGGHLFAVSGKLLPEVAEALPDVAEVFDRHPRCESVVAIIDKAEALAALRAAGSLG